MLTEKHHNASISIRKKTINFYLAMKHDDERNNAGTKNFNANIQMKQKAYEQLPHHFVQLFLPLS